MAEEGGKKKLPETVEEGFDPDLDSLLDDALSDFTQLSQASTFINEPGVSSLLQASTVLREPGLSNNLSQNSTLINEPGVSSCLSQASTVIKEPGESRRLSQASNVVNKPGVQASTVVREPGSATEERDSEAIWNDLVLKVASYQFESEAHSSESEESSDELAEKRMAFKKMAEDAEKDLELEAMKNYFSTAMGQTLKKLSDNTENLQNQILGDPDGLTKMFEFLNTNADDDAGGQPPQDFPFFQQIIQTFLSKEVLYPSMKELLDKYPAWLEENKAKLSKEEYTKYQKQQKIVIKVCSEFELESASDSKEVTDMRFKKIMELMQKMQNYGFPPEELMGNMTMPVDGHGKHEGIEHPDQCCVA